MGCSDAAENFCFPLRLLQHYQFNVILVYAPWNCGYSNSKRETAKKEQPKHFC